MPTRIIPPPLLTGEEGSVSGVISFPNTIEWRAVIQGLLSQLTKDYFWDDNGPKSEALDIGREIEMSYEEYALLNHTHDSYSPLGHTHQLNGLGLVQGSLQGASTDFETFAQLVSAAVFGDIFSASGYSLTCLKTGYYIVLADMGYQPVTAGLHRFWFRLYRDTTVIKSYFNRRQSGDVNDTYSLSIIRSLFISAGQAISFSTQNDPAPTATTMAGTFVILPVWLQPPADI